jgi:diaminopimelate epimerase
MFRTVMKFTKMHGIGNDYVYVNGFEERVDDPGEVARKVSDRHFGIGSDGLILILPSDKADVRMRMFNVDGSEGEMCGNGIRCVAKYAWDHGLTHHNPMRVETGRGVLTLALTVVEGKAREVSVNMGEPILESEKIPTTVPDPRVIDYPLPDNLGGADNAWWRECGLDPRLTCVSTGNPHVILFCKDVAKVPLERVGPWLENWEKFPRRINVHFAQVHSPGEVTMRTWERGSGITWACGTGACSVLVAGALTGRMGRKALVHLPGGDLNIEWRESDNQIVMTGPATEVFNGEWRG